MVQVFVTLPGLNNFIYCINHAMRHGVYTVENDFGIAAVTITLFYDTAWELRIIARIVSLVVCYIYRIMNRMTK